MDAHHASTLLIVRQEASTASSWLPGAVRGALARPHPLLPGHVSVSDAHGVLRVARLGEDGQRTVTVAAYELQLSTGECPLLMRGGFAQPVRKEWSAFELLAVDGLLLCQRGSARILFAQLPMCEGERGAAFLFGSHDAPVLCLAANRSFLLSGGADGCVRLWGLDSGALLGSRRLQEGGAVHVTAVAYVGPLMAAAGSDRGDVCVYDISTKRLEAVQRFHVDVGPVTALACRTTPQQAHDMATALAPRTLDGGGAVAGPAGLPWRGAQGGQEEEAGGALSGGTGAKDAPGMRG
ncbi:hypothetical protein TSOC_013170 [Tetrabaena socialis]|uniref:Uncharacterized protein n=1 Tax=Tetrabaena socialis TaxID=47790 RepID=A0A2J7ZL40_9CHLO|nr:hypothetical protein TSOC_013170 [Tetrabaena socialis]|eukprot:PNH00981.1 hypothetical protein TSOC_013170 [Tetrabaena socialis]